MARINENGETWEVVPQEEPIVLPEPTPEPQREAPIEEPVPAGSLLQG